MEKTNPQTEKPRLLKRASVIKLEFKKQTTTALIAAFGLVIALSWQDLIKNIVGSIPKRGILLYHPYLEQLYTALIVTFIGALAILLITSWANRQSEQNK